MQKNDFVALVAKSSGLTITQADAAFVAIFEQLTQLLAKKDDLVVNRFGQFSTTVREPRTFINPATGHEIKMPKITLPKFKSSPVLKIKVSR